LSAGLRPDPLGELTALPDSLAGFKGPTSKEGEGKSREATGGEGREWKGREGETVGPAPYT